MIKEFAFVHVNCRSNYSLFNRNVGHNVYIWQDNRKLNNFIILLTKIVNFEDITLVQDIKTFIYIKNHNIKFQYLY